MSLQTRGASASCQLSERQLPVQEAPYAVSRVVNKSALTELSQGLVVMVDSRQAVRTSHVIIEHFGLELRSWLEGGNHFLQRVVGYCCQPTGGNEATGDAMLNTEQQCPKDNFFKPIQEKCSATQGFSLDSCAICIYSSVCLLSRSQSSGALCTNKACSSSALQPWELIAIGQKCTDAQMHRCSCMSAISALLLSQLAIF